MKHRAQNLRKQRADVRAADPIKHLDSLRLDLDLEFRRDSYGQPETETGSTLVPVGPRGSKLQEIRTNPCIRDQNTRP